MTLTGLIMTKMDGDARGGAALSVTRVTGVPIKFIGTGERSDALEQFHPDRMASRILAMGDVMTLIEKAQATVDEGPGQGDGAEVPPGNFRSRGFPGTDSERQEDGFFEPDHGDDSRHGPDVQEDAHRLR